MFMENAATCWAYEAQWIQKDEANQSTVLGFILHGQDSAGIWNSFHIICHIIPFAKIINRGAKNMTLILLTRTTETLKTWACAHTHAGGHYSSGYGHSQFFSTLRVLLPPKPPPSPSHSNEENPELNNYGRRYTASVLIHCGWIWYYFIIPCTLTKRLCFLTDNELG